MLEKTAVRAGAAGVAMLLLPAGAPAEGQDRDRSDYTEMAPQKLAEHLIFEAGGFAVDQQTQEDGKLGERLEQDKLQKICSRRKGGEVGSDTAKQVREIARSNMAYPEGGVELGDWKKGQAIAENAFGWRVGHKVDDHGERDPGGLCINCHALEEGKAHRSGTLGPSLTGYGDERGRDQETIKYTYEMIYNPHVAFPCTNMPRLGANGVLTKAQIKHVLAYLLDPDSPVNQ